jgi:hypothetical protein
MRHNNIFNRKIITTYVILLIFLYIYSIYAVWDCPVDGYEGSIYLATPAIFWIMLFLMYITCFIFELQEDSIKYTRFIQYILLLLASVSFCALYRIRGYLPYNISGDTGIHLGNINTGIFEAIIYPLSLVEPKIFCIISSTDVETAFYCINIIFIFILIIGSYLLSKEILNNKKISNIILILLCVLPFGSSTYTMGGWSLSTYIPYILSFMIVPITLYLVQKLSKNKQGSTSPFYLISVIMIFSILLYHPISFIVVMVYIVLLILFWMYRFISGVDKIYSSIFTLAIISVILAIIWMLSISTIEDNILLFKDILLNEEINSVYIDRFGQASSQVGDNMPYSELLYYLITQTGQIILFGISIFIWITFSFRKCNFFNQIQCNNDQFKILCALLIPLGLISLILLVENISPWRLSPLLSLVGIFTIGIILCNLWNTHSKYKTITKSIVIIIFIIICILSITTYYQSIDTATPPNHTTEGTISGAEYLFNYINYDFEKYSVNFPLKNYAIALFGNKYLQTGGKDMTFYSAISKPPTNFEIDSSSQFGAYLIITESALVAYNDIPKYTFWNHTSPWSRNDYQKLSYNEYISKVYSNKELDLWIY